MDRMSTLPTIKCSSCAVDIDILHLADHVCAAVPAPAAPVPEPMSPTSTVVTDSPQSLLSPKINRAATFGGPTFSNRSDRPAPSGRMPPPARIDSNAANKPFRPLEPSPISDYSNPPSRSPGLAPPKSPYKMNRSVTSPVDQSRAPRSPGLSSNLDCAFPPFRPKTPTSAKPQPRERLDPYQNYAQPSPLFAPLSPRFDGGENITKRMNTIAPGPFDGKNDRRPTRTSASSQAVDASTGGHQRTGTQGSISSNRSFPQVRSSVTSNTSRSSGFSNRSVGLPSHPKLRVGNIEALPPHPQADEQTEGIDAFLDRLQKESSRSSQPVPPAQENITAEPVRQNSRGKREPPPRPRRPSERDLPPMDMSDLDTSDFFPPANMFPSPGPSRNGSVSDMPRGLAPSRSLRPPPLAAAGPSDGQLNSLHTPSDSGFSDDSYGSSGIRSTASSRSSPPESEAAHSRQASKIGRPDYAAEENSRRSPSPNGLGSYPRALSPGPRQPMFPPGINMQYPESPIDPAVQMGARTPLGMFPKDPMTQDYSRSPLRSMAEPEVRQQDAQRPKPASKGNCRGCSEPIVGKSVKDSSGRLTGRYHKHCFVCRECADPFPTAEFYVFNNSPYCERHYHKLNGSLCNTCNRGIEGQYLETDTRQKFHPRCFACFTCRLILRDGYFEVAGRRYCERHAQSAAAPPRNHLGPGNYRPRNLQKRGTRLMMMA
ncbi:hypothetical protein COCCADRAFT_3276 [Bipolaris zeicola 26-R-13]|uniref:LIM zinc-binding domain-containing protein n=1 Tax=Cochliobolus carbonum (strain 26-R-13) TaxID=930089 RepID=W6YVG8_COCC2|nr:uncharacterized protein COCCADRAFT_3276 [Bipolaris zeicola 26-R-13]EUC35466.1 hypothetical protein COCCADRAFT_3276 [Bipolaris zeicola 26-R-13]